MGAYVDGLARLGSHSIEPLLPACVGRRAHRGNQSPAGRGSPSTFQGGRLRFPSTPRGHAGSDVDVLVIEPTVGDSMTESVRLRRLLRGLGVPIDVVVVGQAEATRRSAVRGTVVERALREGRVLVDA